MADKNKREAWKNFTKAMKEKRCGTKTTKARKGKGQESDREELTIQRLSAEVHGKAQKYSRVGPREFVDFSNLEMTVENIKKACTDHFKSSIGTGMVCDILAGDQGPSCRTVKQIPNLQLIHVRFIPEGEGDADVEILDTKSKGSPEASLKRKNRSLSPPPKSKMVSRIPPRSLSVSTILQLGRLVAPKTTLVNLFSFHLHSLRWSNIPIPVEFDISDDILGEGAFRKAYKAATSTKDFSHATWVIKRYKPEAVKQIEDMNQTVEYQTKKVVQMHHLAQNFATEIEAKIEKEDLSGVFGPTLKYKNIYLGNMNGESVSVEEFVDGTFTKYINNDGLPCGNIEEDLHKKAECLSHYSYVHSEKQVMVVDIQGAGYNMFDPEIASAILVDKKEVMFTAGNLSHLAINNFIEQHTCNMFCKCLGLEPLSLS